MNPTTLPWRANGARYGIGLNGERICLGALMGRADAIPADAATVRKLRLVRLRPSGLGDYDQGGAYWGGMYQHPVYCAFGESDTEKAHVFLRADSREEAKRAALARFPNAAFYR